MRIALQPLVALSFGCGRGPAPALETEQNALAAPATGCESARLLASRVRLVEGEPGPPESLALASNPVLEALLAEDDEAERETVEPTPSAPDQCDERQR